MFKEVFDDPADSTLDSKGVLRDYPAPWQGQLVLVCRKCQKKLRRDGKKSGLAKLNRTLAKRARHHDDRLALYVVGVSCLKMCPKAGVTVCTQQQLARQQCSIIRNDADIDALIDRCKLEVVQG